MADGKNKKLCYEWSTNKSFINTLPYLAVVLVILINKMLEVMFTKLSKFEGHKSYTGEKASLLIKTFLSSLMNTGFIILIMNYRFTLNENNIFKGKYEDMNTLWYRSVGSTILITLIVNVLQKPISSIVWSFIRTLTRFIDRSCSNDQSKTRKVYQKDYNRVYTGPEFRIDLRYAGILT